MTDHLKLYLFGDQTYDVQPDLKDLMRSRTNPILENFLTKAYNAIRTESYELPCEIREGLPRFTCLEDLILREPDGKRCIPLDIAVTCMYQLGIFIHQADPWHYGANNSRILGLCTGALAAAAVSCSRSLLELIPIAVDAVIIAFRTGMLVIDVAQRVEPFDTSDRSWSIIVAGAASAEAISRLCEQSARMHGNYCMQRLCPPAADLGPHSDTSPKQQALYQRIHAKVNFKDLGCKTFKIEGLYGPYHASHLYSQSDAEEIVGTLVPGSTNMHPNRIPLFSSTGTTVEGANFEALLKAAVEQILRQPIRWSGIVEELQSCLQATGSKKFSVVSFGSMADQLIYTALKQTSLATLLSSKTGPSKPSPPEIGSEANPGIPKLAIIGMSRRFPGAKDNDVF